MYARATRKMLTRGQPKSTKTAAGPRVRTMRAQQNWRLLTGSSRMAVANSFGRRRMAERVKINVAMALPRRAIFLMMVFLFGVIDRKTAVISRVAKQKNQEPQAAE